jgi:hypothetical protein
MAEIPPMTSMWERKQWAALAAMLVLVILALLDARSLIQPASAPAYDHIVVRVVDGPTVLSTQVIPLR